MLPKLNARDCFGCHDGRAAKVLLLILEDAFAAHKSVIDKATPLTKHFSAVSSNCLALSRNLRHNSILVQASTPDSMLLKDVRLPACFIGTMGQGEYICSIYFQVNGS
jgi:hypothetical protein